MGPCLPPKQCPPSIGKRGHESGFQLIAERLLVLVSVEAEDPDSTQLLQLGQSRKCAPTAFATVGSDAHGDYSALSKEMCLQCQLC